MSVRYVGEVGQNFGAASASTITFTASRAVPVGDIVILAARGAGLQVVSSVSDTEANTWVKLGNTTTANTCNVWYSVLTTAFTTSTVVTATYPGTPANRIVGAWAFDGITRPTTVTELASGSAVTTLSPASLSVPQYGSLFFSAISLSVLPTWTDPTGFTALPVTSSAVSLRAAYLIRSSMDSVSTTWSWNLSGNGGVVSGSFTPDGGDLFNVF
jgi:hypothetical protein